jgi:hypothetical protein
VLEALPNLTVLLDDEITSSSSGKAVDRIVARKHANG